MGQTLQHRAVIFDLGGVVLDSPFDAIATFERERGIPGGFVNRVIVDTGCAGAWSNLERGHFSLEEFFAPFERDCADAGHRLDARALMERIFGGLEPRPVMLEAIRRIRSRGLTAAALTNNWRGDSSHELVGYFDYFIESSVVGLHKPDPAIYQHTCAKIGIEPAEAIFLDDIGRNLKSAKALGMSTIKVGDPGEALRELQSLLGFPLGIEG